MGLFVYISKLSALLPPQPKAQEILKYFILGTYITFDKKFFARKIGKFTEKVLQDFGNSVFKNGPELVKLY